MANDENKRTEKREGAIIFNIYIMEIDRLLKENEELKEENERYKKEVSDLFLEIIRLRRRLPNKS